MKYNLFFNIGGQDLKLNGVKLEPARTKGSEVLSKYDMEKSNIQIPIIQPLIEKFKEDIEKVYLFVTDQSENSGYIEKDTINFGKIIERILNDRFGLVSKMFYIQFNPTDYGLLFDFYQKILQDFENDNNIFSISGGTPQMNGTLFFVGSNMLNNLEVYRVDEASGDVVSVDYKNTIRKNLIINQCLLLLNNYNYMSMLRILGNEHIENMKLKLLLEYCTHRLYFDFELANKKIDELISWIDPSDKAVFNKIKIENNRDYVWLISELYTNIMIKWQNEEYVDFLGRLFRFQEALIRYVFENITSISTGKSRETGFKEFRNYIEKDNDLKSFLEREKIKCQEPTVLCLRYLIKYMINQRLEERELLKEINDFADKIEKLGELRNKTIMAHGFEGVSKEVIANTYRPDKLVTDLEKIIRFINKNYSNEFNDINLILKDLIQEL